MVDLFEVVFGTTSSQTTPLRPYLLHLVTVHFEYPTVVQSLSNESKIMLPIRVTSDALSALSVEDFRLSVRMATGIREPSLLL